QVARRVRDAGGHGPARGLPGGRILDPRPGSPAPPRRARAALRRDGLLRLLVRARARHAPGRDRRGGARGDGHGAPPALSRQRARLLTGREGTRLERGLVRVRRELDAGRFRFLPSDEDIHMAIERRLTELVGPVGGKLHTGRSRNDQVALDLRLWLRAECDTL